MGGCPLARAELVVRFVDNAAIARGRDEPFLEKSLHMSSFNRPSNSIERRDIWRPGVVSAPVQGSLHMVTVDGESEVMSAVSLIGLIPTGSRVMCHIAPNGLVYVDGYLANDFGPSGALDAVAVTTTGAILSAVSAETVITGLDLSFMASANVSYLVSAQINVTQTVPADDWDIRCRENDAAGALVGDYVFSGYDTVGTPSMFFVYTPVLAGKKDLVFTIARRAGSGTVSVFGGPGSGGTRTITFVSRFGRCRFI